jgi:hypothetical protein
MSWALAGASACTWLTMDQNWPVKNGFYTYPANCVCGQYANSDTNNKFNCKTCPQGSYCPGGGVGLQPCPASMTHCPAGSGCGDNQLCREWEDCYNATPINCVWGQYMVSSLNNPKASSGVCNTCEAGYVCPLWGSVTRRPVDPGYYSPAGVPIQYICPAGYSCTATGTLTACNAAQAQYSPVGDYNCYSCVAPWACPYLTLGALQQINCANKRGYYQDANNQLFCKQCPPGYYCPYGAPDKLPCPAGSWSIGAQEYCTLCLAGFECPSTTMPQSNACLIGTYSLVGQASCTICPKNYECIQNIVLPCWNGSGKP